MIALNRRAFVIVAAVTAMGLLHAAGQTTSRPVPPTSSSTSTSTSAVLRIACYNMNYGVTDKESLAEYVRIIRNARPDIIAIQEGSPEVYRYLQQELVREYPYIKFEPGVAATGLGWLSKVPLRRPLALPKIEGGWFGTSMMEIDLPGQTVLLANVHLMATVPTGNPKPTELIALVQGTEATRDKEMRRIQEAVAKKVGERCMGVVMLGDFNSLPGLKAPTFLREKGYTDSQAAANTEPDATWRYIHPDAKWSLRIDYIFHNAAVKTLRGHAVQEGPSDHAMVWSDLKFTPSAASQPATQPR